LFASRFGRADSSGHALPNQFALEFGKSSKNVKEESSHWIAVVVSMFSVMADETNTEAKPVPEWF
jgi:hypothetical protein